MWSAEAPYSHVCPLSVFRLFSLAQDSAQVEERSLAGRWRAAGVLRWRPAGGTSFSSSSFVILVFFRPFNPSWLHQVFLRNLGLSLD